MAQIFTGQKIVKQIPDGRGSVAVVACNKCKDHVSLRVAWFDPYPNERVTKNGKYVHYGCLSTRRVNELAVGK